MGSNPKRVSCGALVNAKVLTSQSQGTLVSWSAVGSPQHHAPATTSRLHLFNHHYIDACTRSLTAAPPTMGSLRRACRSCTAAKRKCVVQTPSCARCIQKGIKCSYDLEHINAPTGDSDVFPSLTYNPSNCDTPGYCILKPLQFRGETIDPAVCAPGHNDNLVILRAIYFSIPDLLRDEKPAVFIHPKLHLQDSYNHCAVFQESRSNEQMYEDSGRLSRVDFKDMSTYEMLTALQALVLYTSNFLFSSNPLHQECAERCIDDLTAHTQNLLHSARTSNRGKQSPWQQWLFGESVRRTIFASYSLVLVFGSFKYGYCNNWLFIESLPIDKRAGLWMAQSPQAWLAAAGASRGEDVGEQLNSFHEYAESVRGTDPQFCGDILLDMLATTHNGPTGRCEVTTSGN